MSTAQAVQTIVGSVAFLFLLIVQSVVQAKIAARQHRQTTAKLETVEATVNGTNSALTERVKQLAIVLQTSGVPIPPTPEVEKA